MELIQELRTLRAALEELCQLTDRIMAQCAVENDAPEEEARSNLSLADRYESIYPLCMEPGFFKGKAAVAVIFPDGVRVETPTWKKLVEVILQRCNDDIEKHQALMDLRNRIQGRSRKLLGSRGVEMRSPIKIDRNLYMEAHYDTESLLRIMKTRILDPVNYDYRNIQVAIRNN